VRLDHLLSKESTQELEDIRFRFLFRF